MVGMFAMAFLLVFTVLESAVNSDFDYSTMECSAIGLDPPPLHPSPMDLCREATFH